MYSLNLTESLIAAQTDDIVREITVGGLLREVASEYPVEPALVEVNIDGETDRTWTYAELLADSEKLALALASRFHNVEKKTMATGTQGHTRLIGTVGSATGVSSSPAKRLTQQSLIYFPIR